MSDAPDADRPPRTPLGDPRLEALAAESGYTIHERIGAGGMGIVYRGDDADGTAVAVKLLRQDISGDPRARERLSREVAAQRMVRSDAIVKILDAELDSPDAFVVTEYIPGPTLEEAVNRYGGLHPEAVREIGLVLGETLQKIHAAGVIHRDLKPSNVMLRGALEEDLISYDPDGPGLDPVIIDFGIAMAAEESRLTSTGLVMGTASYLDPQVVRTNHSAPAGDWWALAALLAFATTGRPPFGTGRAELVFLRAERGDIDVDGAPAELAAWLRSALQAEPADRPDPEDLLVRLDELDLDVFEEAGATEALAAGTSALPAGATGRERSGSDGADAGRTAAAAAAVPLAGGPEATEMLPAGGGAGATEVFAAGPGATEALSAGPEATELLAAGSGTTGTHGYGAHGAGAPPIGPSTPVDATPGPSEDPRTEMIPVIDEPATQVLPPVQDGPATQVMPIVRAAPGQSAPPLAGSAPAYGQDDYGQPLSPGFPVAPEPVHRPAPAPQPAPARYEPPQQVQPAQPSWTPVAQSPAQPPQPQMMDPQAMQPGYPQPWQMPLAPRRHLLVWMGHLIVLGLAAVAPYFAITLLILLGALARTWERSHRALAMRRARGSAGTGGAIAVGTASPFRFVLAVIEVVLQAILPLVLGLLIGVAVDGAAALSGTVLPDAVLFTIAIGVTLLLVWVGLGSRTTRDGAHRLLDAAAPDRTWTAVVAALLLLILVALGATILVRGGQVDYLPFGDLWRLEDLLPWRRR